MDELSITATQVDELKNTPDKLDKYRDYLLGRGRLTEKQHEMLANYRKAFAWRCKGFSHQHVMQMLKQDATIDDAMAYRILQEATKLYGRVEDIDKEGTRRILIEHLYIAMSIAIKNRDSNSINSTVEKIAKLSKVYDENPQLTPSDLMPAKTIVFNRIDISNYNVPTTTPENEIEDAEFGD